MFKIIQYRSGKLIQLNDVAFLKSFPFKDRGNKFPGYPKHFFAFHKIKYYRENDDYYIIVDERIERISKEEIHHILHDRAFNKDFESKLGE